MTPLYSFEDFKKELSKVRTMYNPDTSSLNLEYTVNSHTHVLINLSLRRKNEYDVDNFCCAILLGMLNANNYSKYHFFNVQESLTEDKEVLEYFSELKDYCWSVLIKSYNERFLQNLRFTVSVYLKTIGDDHLSSDELNMIIKEVYVQDVHES